MGLKAFKKITASGTDDLDRLLNSVQTNVSEGLNQVLNKQIVDGILLPAQALKIGNNTINHKLGRKALGYLIISKNANANIYDDIIAEANSTSFNINSSAVCSVVLWVF